ncbi:MAG: molybdopterin-dependent oxidoreductase [Pseudomonadota bacterium]
MKAHLFAVLCCFASIGHAAPKAVTLDPMQHHSAEILVVNPDGNAVTYTPAELETFPNYRLSTTTPWRDETAQFDGVLLRDVLEANGLADATAILVTAENDFSATIPREVWETHDVLVATRVDDKPHSRRARGPIQIVIDMAAYEASEVAREEHLVWMAARIEAVK